MHNAFQDAAQLICEADSLVITAGAGMEGDSRLSDFRGNEGFWQAYPALAKAQISFTEIACPDTFESNPNLAWDFTGIGSTCIATPSRTWDFATCAPLMTRARLNPIASVSYMHAHEQARFWGLIPRESAVLGRQSILSWRLRSQATEDEYPPPSQ